MMSSVPQHPVLKVRLFVRLVLLAVGLGLTVPAAGAGAVASSFGPLEAAQPLSARGLADQIRRDGAQAVARMLTREREWPRVRRAVAAGWEGWIALLPDLMPAADAATGRSLQDALHRALPRNPRAVLSVLDRENSTSLGGRTICAAGAEPVSWRRRAIASIRDVHDIHLVDQGTDCLHALEEAS